MITTSVVTRPCPPADDRAALPFDLPGVLLVAEHALTAPASLYHPEPDGAATDPALVLTVAESACVWSAGLPAQHTSTGAPYTVTADRPGDVADWLAACRCDPHEVLDPAEAVSGRLRTGQRCGRRAAVTGLWYLPLSAAAVTALRCAAAAGVSGVLIEPTALRLVLPDTAGRGPAHATASLPASS